MCLVWFDSYDRRPPRLRSLPTGAEQPLDGAWDAVFSPDGTRLAVIRATADGQCCRSMLADLTDATPALQGQPQHVSRPVLIQGLRGVRWSSDSQYVLIPTQEQDSPPIHVLALRWDGAVVGSAALPQAVIGDLGLLHGTQLVVIVNEVEGSFVRSIPLLAADSAAIPATALPTTGDGAHQYMLVHTP